MPRPGMGNHPGVAPRRLPTQEGAKLLEYKFIDFVKWPAGAIDDTGSFVICVVDKLDVASVVERTVEGKRVRGLPLEVTHLTASVPTSVCHILFLGGDDRSFDLLGSLPRTPGTLTVSDTANFTRRGGIIGFFLRGGKVRYEINLMAAEKSGLQISSRLLRVASVVR